MKISITKMHGLGNDFLVINNFSNKIKISPKQIAFLCDRHKGIGSDGLILVEKRPKVDCFMNYYNSDGSLAQMCGNGVRCTALFFLENMKSKKKILSIGTRAGVKSIVVNKDKTFTVNMGKAIFKSKDFPENSKNIEKLKFNFVSMGNPHAVTTVKDLKHYDIASIGKKVEHSRYFPKKINVEFVEKLDCSNFKVAVWERGSGLTLACGTGACAVYAFLHSNHMCSDTINIILPGGTLEISENQSKEILMRGGASFVFKTFVNI